MSSLRHSNSQTALRNHGKQRESDLGMNILRAAPQSGDYPQVNSDTGGAIGSSIHFTIEDNSL